MALGDVHSLGDVSAEEAVPHGFLPELLEHIQLLFICVALAGELSPGPSLRVLEADRPHRLAAERDPAVQRCEVERHELKELVGEPLDYDVDLHPGVLDVSGLEPLPPIRIADGLDLRRGLPSEEI